VDGVSRVILARGGWVGEEEISTLNRWRQGHVTVERERRAGRASSVFDISSGRMSA